MSAGLSAWWQDYIKNTGGYGENFQERLD